MSLGAMQACFVRLCVDDGFRARFMDGSERTLDGYALSTTEHSALRSIDRAALDAYAASLEKKRSWRLRKMYPLLFDVAEAQCERLLPRFHQFHPAKPNRSRYRDFVDFGLFVEDAATAASAGLTYVADVARYERLSYCAFVGITSRGAVPLAPPAPHDPAPLLDGERSKPALRPGVEIVGFDYDVARIETARATSTLDGSYEPFRDPHWLLFAGAVAGGDARRLRINALTKTVLGFSDGTRTVAEIIAATEAALQREPLRDRVHLTLERSIALQILNVRKTG